jgi:hypothetical protein
MLNMASNIDTIETIFDRLYAIWLRGGVSSSWLIEVILSLELLLVTIFLSWNSLMYLP